MHYSWRIVALTMLMQAVSYGSLVYAFALFVVPWLNEFGMARTDVMLAIFSLQIVSGIFSPFAGRLLDTYSPHWLVPLGGLSLACGLALISFATSWWQVILVYASLLPVGMALTGPLAAQIIITKWFQEKRGFAIGISAIGTSIGGFLVPILCSILLTQYDWRTTILYLASLALLLICPLSWFILQRRPPIALNLTAALGEGALPASGEQSWTTREILSTRVFWLPIIAFLGLGLAFSGVQFNLPALAQDLGNSLSRSAWLVSLLSLSTIVGKFCFGYLSDRIDHRILYWCAAGFMSLTLILIQSEPSYTALCTASIFMGLAIGGWLPLLGIIYGKRFGAQSFGRVMGLAMMFITFGGLGSLIAGSIFDATGSYDNAFILFLCILTPCAACLIALRKDLPTAPKPR